MFSAPSGLTVTCDGLFRSGRPAPPIRPPPDESPPLPPPPTRGWQACVASGSLPRGLCRTCSLLLAVVVVLHDLRLCVALASSEGPRPVSPGYWPLSREFVRAQWRRHVVEII